MSNQNQKKTLTVKYTVYLTDSDLDRLYKQAREQGSAYDDAGPQRAVKRLLVDGGIQGAFPGELQLDAEYDIEGEK